MKKRAVLLVGMVLACVVGVFSQIPSAVKVSANSVLEVRQQKNIGIGVCISPIYVLTNYHIIMNGKQSDWRVGGLKIRSVMILTDDGDGEVSFPVLNGVIRVNPNLDIVLLELEKELPSSIQCIRPASRASRVGDKVYKISLKNGATEISQGEIIPFDGLVSSHIDTKIVKSDGFAVNISSTYGDSGSLIVNQFGEMIGQLNFFDQSNFGISLAIPLKTVSRLLEKKSDLWKQFFFGKELVSDQEIAELKTVLDQKPERLSEEELLVLESLHFWIRKLGLKSVSTSNDFSSKDVIDGFLKKSIQHLNQMNNLVAEQEIARGNEREKYQLMFYQGKLMFRQIGGNGKLGKELSSLPFPDNGLVPGAEWYYMLRDVLVFRALQYGFVGELDGKKVHVLTFSAEKGCFWREKERGGLFQQSSLWQDYIDCEGFVVLRQDLNPLTIVQIGYPPAGRLVTQVVTQVDYAEAVIGGRSALVPTRLTLDGVFARPKVVRSRLVVRWGNYKRFTTHEPVVIELDEVPP